jgi:Ras-related protein Rab-7A
MTSLHDKDITTKKTLFKILILGDSGVGKTSIMYRYINNKFSFQYKATIGADFFTKEILVDDRLVTLQIWDTAGQERFFSLGKSFYRGADCCILVHDITNSKSLTSLETWKKDFTIEALLKNPETFPFVLLSNKTDLDRTISSRQLDIWCAENGNMARYETSAKDGTNIENAFKAATKLAMQHYNNDISTQVNEYLETRIRLSDDDPCPPYNNKCSC